MTSPLEQKKIKITGPSVVTANRTWDGVVVYRTAAKSWSADLSEAAIVRNSDEAKALLAESVADDVGAIGPYIAPVQVGDGRQDRARQSARTDPPHRRDHRPAGSRLKAHSIMYAYDEIDRTLVDERVAEFRDQVERRLSGELTEDEFKPLRLQNGLYLQLHAYMLRIAIPYGTLSSSQLRQLAHVARKYDRGYGHFTTRQNIQFNWIKLEELPDTLADLAEVEMHAIQTSGNCIRNVTADHFAGVAADEIDDPRVWSEMIRQWSTLHPEFTFLPRKFKIAITASDHDRAAIKVHDIGLRLIKNEKGEIGFEVLVGGGLGRTPFIGKTIRTSSTAAICSPISRRSCASTTATAAATTTTRRASRSWCTSSASRSSRARSRRSGSTSATRSLPDRRRGDRGHPLALHASGLREAAAHAGRAARRPRHDPAFGAWRKNRSPRTRCRATPSSRSR